MSFKRLLSVATLVVFASAMPLAQAPDPLLGTWKLNPAKSKGNFKSGTSVFESTGDGIKATVDLVGADGTAYHWSFAGKYDGKDNPVTGKNPYGDTVAFTHPNANTYNVVVKKGGKQVVTQTITVAADGKTRTTTVKGTDAKGQPIEGMSFYEKQ